MSILKLTDENFEKYVVKLNIEIFIREDSCFIKK